MEFLITKIVENKIKPQEKKPIKKVSGNPKVYMLRYKKIDPIKDKNIFTYFSKKTTFILLLFNIFQKKPIKIKEIIKKKYDEYS